MLHINKNRLSDERGVEIVEFLGIMPLLLMIGLIIWQFLIVGHTMLITESAAREGARAAAAHKDCNFAVYKAIGLKAIPIYWPDIQCGRCSGSGGPVEVTVRLRIPIVPNPWVRITGPIWTEAKAVFRCEPKY
jgi:pilus assembly protein CpaE